jgi:hypothetical protein
VDRWPAHVTDILGGDLVVALGYRTPAAGVVATPVTTLGMYDGSAGTITTTTSFGNGKKLTRIERDDRVALLFHAREFGTATGAQVVLAQGHASFPDRPDGGWLTPDVEAAWDRLLVPRKRGPIWDWVGREYYDLRVPIVITVHRLVVWPDPEATGQPEVIGTELPAEAPPSQTPPKGGTGTRVEAKRYAKRLDRARHRVVAWVGADGFPMMVPARLQRDGDRLRVESPVLPDGRRRAGVLAHWFEPRLKGQGNALLTGWLDAEDGAGAYHPHTAAGYALPRLNDVGFTLGAGLATKVAYRELVKAGHVRDGVWQRRRAA